MLNEKTEWIETGETNINIKSKNPYKVISLFSGCGGKDLGVQGGFDFLNHYYGKNDFEIVFANDFTKHACKTYSANFNHEILFGDIRLVDVSRLPKADVVIGGFPCQDFSMSGTRKVLTSERGTLYIQMKRVIDEIKPTLFVAENVQGLTNLNGTATIEKIKDDLRKSNYLVSHHLLNAADFGVPQARKRVFIIGIKNDFVDIRIPYPISTHGQSKKLNWITSKEAIDDLWFEINSGKFDNHTLNDFSKAKFYPGRKMQGNLRIDPNKPSPTIRSEHHGNIEGHYRCIGDLETEDVTKWRRLSVRECARLQTFPDNFKFPVSPSLAYKVIGNAVPPVLAWHIFRAINIFLIKRKIEKIND
jgi:DNA (cytosine-5)-methyltransferase 1